MVWRGDKSPGAVLYRVKKRHGHRAAKCLGRSLRDEHQGYDQADGDQDHDAPYQQHPEVADSRSRPSHKRIDERDKNGESDCRREEVLDDKANHLRKVTDGHFRHIRLPVGVGCKADRSVEREIQRHGPESCRVERQELLHLLDHKDNTNAGDRKDHDGNRKLLPVHLLPNSNSAHREDFLLDPINDRREKVWLTGKNLCNPCTKGHGNECNDKNKEDQLGPVGNIHPEDHIRDMVLEKG